MGGNVVLPSADPTNSEHNAFVQDWLSRWREKYIGEVTEGPGDRFDDANDIESAIELIQGTYSYQDHEARKVPYEVQVKQHQIEQLKATQRRLEREVANHYATIRTMSCELATAQEKLRQFESDVAQAIRTLQGT
jgi:chromosome segregation ATPase